MGRLPCCDKVGLKKGTWTSEEDQKLLTYIQQHGHGSWRALPAKAGLQRCGKSCRLRWTNYLRPDIKRGKFSLQEEQTIIQLHALLGNRWSAIATHLPKRTDNEIKNYWNTHLKKRLTKMGIDPTTHKSKTNTLSSNQQRDTANLSHMAQWESARLEAEARESKKMFMSITIPFQNKPTFQPLDILKVWQRTWTTKSGANLSSPTSNNGVLVSPTSTLNFSDSMFTHPSTPCFGANFRPFQVGNNYIQNPKYEAGMATKNENVLHDLKCAGNPNDDHDHQQPVEANTSTIQLAEIEYPDPIEASAAYVTEDSLTLPCFMEGIASILSNTADDHEGGHNPRGPYLSNVDGSSSGDLEDNNGNYWNNILNDVATGTSVVRLFSEGCLDY